MPVHTLLKMPPEVHALVKNADNINAAVNDAIEQKVGTRPEFIVASAHFGTCPADRRLRRRGPDVLPELADIKFSLVGAPAFLRVVPDFIKIDLGTR